MKGQKCFACAAQPVSRTPCIQRLAGRLIRWHELSQQRAFLRRISDAALKDLGLSRADIEIESQRAFWDDPFNR